MLSRIEGGAIMSNSLTNSRRLRSEVISAIRSTLSLAGAAARPGPGCPAPAPQDRRGCGRGRSGPGISCELPANKPKEVDVLEEARRRRRRGESRAGACLCCVIRSSASKMKSSASTATTSKWQTSPDRSVERQPTQHDGLREVHAGDDADALAVADEQCVDVAVAHGAPASSIVASPSMNTPAPKRASRTRARRTVSTPSSLRARRRRRACARRRNRRRRRRPDCGGSGSSERLAGNKVAERLFGGDEVLAGRAVHDGARVEAVLRAKHGLQAAAVPDLDRALDDDVELLRRVRPAWTMTSPGRK